MKRLLNSRPVDQALRGAALVVTDRRWAAPLSAAALGFGIFAGVAIGPGTAGSLATGAQQIIEIPSSGGDDGQSGGGGGGIASNASSLPSLGDEASGGLEESLPSTAPLAPEPIEPLPAPTTEPAAKPTPASEESDGEAEKAEGQSFEGTVVHANPAAGSYAIAIKGGELVSIHAAELPEPGTKLSASLRRLANGTFAETDDIEEEKKQATEVTFRGVVSFLNSDPVAPAYTVSGRGSSLLVHVPPDPAGATPALPALGSSVTVTAEIEEPESPAELEEPKATATLVQSKVEVEPGPPTTYLDMAGIVEEVLPDGHLLFSADWVGESESTITLAVAAEIDAKRLKAGDSYLATAEIADDGSLTLKGIASDEYRKGADDASSAQGDLKR